ncbi:hypothetical protein [Mesorhizobium sp. WSM3876]|uniref:hypothetical protein n=1 Tax=Mesorhizobium sp. WSM3876 TaxID=422277 RepID=UPI000BAFA018|nr:hypothetical protein [Mesorhizobium sp. WSM3876]PBB84044.1 hypothetical protein CK216_24980 [Mesorhizobium sp. WSM3876]
MARPVEIGDRVAVIATVTERVEDRVTVAIPTDCNTYSIVEPNAKPGDKLQFEGEVVHVDEDLGRTTIQVLGRITVDTRSVKMMRKYRQRRLPPANSSDQHRPDAGTAPRPRRSA